jgi:hypothetical protein
LILPGERAMTSLERGPSELAVLVHRPGILDSQITLDDLGDDDIDQ